MFKRKSLISLAAVLALSGSIFADTDATYIRMTNENNDASWKMFGVMGFSDGIGSDVTVAPSNFSGGYALISDGDGTGNAGAGNAADDLRNPGLLDGANPLGYMQQLGALSQVEGAVDISDVSFSPTEPVRSMYIKVGNVNAPNIKFDYKASLEGKKMELMVNGEEVKYFVTISDEATYTNPAVAVTPDPDIEDASNLISMTKIVDYDFSNNPTNPANYDYEKHHNAPSAASSSTFYYYDAVAQQWNIWDKNNNAAANDFTELEKGRGYWGRIDTGDRPDALNNDDDGSSGLILGTSGQSNQPDATIYENKLAEGWNLLAFDDIRPTVRHASTGMVATLKQADSSDLSFNITGDAGVYQLTITLTAAATTSTLAAKEINMQVESARKLGTVPPTFTIRAMSVDANNILFVSDKQFTLSETTQDDVFAGVVTLTGLNPIVAGERAAVVDLGNTSGLDTATSAYGEYGMMLNVLTGTGTAADLDANGASVSTGTNVSAKILFGDSDGANSALRLGAGTDDAPTLASAKAQIETDPIFNATDGSGKANLVDTDFDGVADHIIVASTIPFYVKDNTFAKVFTYDAAAAVANSGAETIDDAIYIDNTTGFEIIDATVAGNKTADLIEDIINAEADTAATGTNVYADVDSNGKLVVVSTGKSGFDLKDVADGTRDFLTDDSSTDDLAQGALKGAYALENVSTLALQEYEFTLDGFNAANVMPDDATDTFSIAFPNHEVPDISDAPYGYDSTVSATNRELVFDTIVNRLNAQFDGSNETFTYTLPGMLTAGSDTFAFDNVSITLADGLDADGVATAIAGESYTNWNVSAVSNVLTFSYKTPQDVAYTITEDAATGADLNGINIVDVGLDSGLHKTYTITIPTAASTASGDDWTFDGDNIGAVPDGRNADELAAWMADPDGDSDFTNDYTNYNASATDNVVTFTYKTSGTQADPVSIYSDTGADSGVTETWAIEFNPAADYSGDETGSVLHFAGDTATSTNDITNSDGLVTDLQAAGPATAGFTAIDFGGTLIVASTTIGNVDNPAFTAAGNLLDTDIDLTTGALGLQNAGAVGAEVWDGDTFDGTVGGGDVVIAQTNGWPAVYMSATHNFDADVDRLDTAEIKITGLGVSDITDPIGVTNAGGLGGSVAPTLTKAATNTNGGLFADLRADIISDVKFNAVYTPNYSSYGPLYTLNEAGYDIKALLKGTTDLTDSSVAWDSIDLTRAAKEWFVDSAGDTHNEYNLFNIDSTIGYWAYLAAKDDTIEVAISDADFSPAFTHHFNNDVSLTTRNVMTTGNFQVKITSNSPQFDLNEEYVNAYAIVSGQEVELAKGSELFTADINKNGTNAISEGDIAGISVRANNGMGVSNKVTDIASIDYQKPATPTITFNNTVEATFASTSADATKFYVFENYIPEMGTESAALIPQIEATAGAAVINMCKEFSYNTLNTLRVIAVDHTGVLGQGNASDQLEFVYANMVKNANVLTHTYDAAGTKAQIGLEYDNNCEVKTQQSGKNAGVSVKAMQAGSTVRMSFQPIAGRSLDTDLPWTAVYAVSGGSPLVQIQNVSDYAGKVFFLQVGDKIYRGNFPTNASDADDSLVTPNTLTEQNVDNNTLTAAE